MREGKVMGKIFGIALVFAVIGAMLGGFPHTADVSASGKFNIGDTVEVYNCPVTSVGLCVRGPADPCGTCFDRRFDGAQGSVLDGPVYCDDHNRWLIRWSDGVEGWSAEGEPGVEDWLKKKYVAPSTKFKMGDPVIVIASTLQSEYFRV